MIDTRPLHIVHTEASCGWGGQEIRILTEAQAMMARGHRVEVWAAAGSDISKEAARRGIPCKTLPIGRKTLAGVRAMRQLLRLIKPDIVNTHSSTDAWSVALASIALAGAPPVVRTRHISAPVPRNWPTRWLYTRATSCVVTTGERLRQALIQENGYPQAQLTSIPTGIDTGRFRPGDRAQARQALGLPLSARIIGIVATLRSWKGHLHLLEAFARLRQTGDNLQLVIVGDGPMQPNIENKISELGLASHVQLAGRQENVERWLQAMDVFCLPSYANEGVPQSLMQAMLVGLPVVTTDVGSITEAVTDGVTGIIVPAQNVGALTDALSRLLRDAALAARLADAAREHAVKNFDLATMVTRMETIFRRVLEQARGSQERV